MTNHEQRTNTNVHFSRMGRLCAPGRTWFSAQKIIYTYTAHVYCTLTLSLSLSPHYLLSLYICSVNFLTASDGGYKMLLANKWQWSRLVFIAIITTAAPIPIKKVGSLGVNSIWWTRHALHFWFLFYTLYVCVRAILLCTACICRD